MAVEKVNECMSRTNSDGVNVLKQGNTTFTWLRDNMDIYWKDTIGSVRDECVECFNNLSSSDGAIAQVSSAAGMVLAAAAEKIAELTEQIETIENQIRELESELASL